MHGDLPSLIHTTATRRCLLVASLGALILSGCAHGTLVTSTPPGATVTVGGDVVGVTPIEVRPTREPIQVETAEAITTFAMTTAVDPDAALLGVSLAALAWVAVLSGVARYVVAAFGPAALNGLVLFMAGGPGFAMLLPISATAHQNMPRAGPKEIHVDFTGGTVTSDPPNRIAPPPPTTGARER